MKKLLALFVLSIVLELHIAHKNRRCGQCDKVFDNSFGHLLRELHKMKRAPYPSIPPLVNCQIITSHIQFSRHSPVCYSNGQSSSSLYVTGIVIHCQLFLNSKRHVLGDILHLVDNQKHVCVTRQDLRQMNIGPNLKLLDKEIHDKCGYENALGIIDPGLVVDLGSEVGLTARKIFGRLPVPPGDLIGVGLGSPLGGDLGGLGGSLGGLGGSLGGLGGGLGLGGGGGRGGGLGGLGGGLGGLGGGLGLGGGGGRGGGLGGLGGGLGNVGGLGSDLGLGDIGVSGLGHTLSGLDVHHLGGGLGLGAPDQIIRDLDLHSTLGGALDNPALGHVHSLGHGLGGDRVNLGFAVDGLREIPSSGVGFGLGKVDHIHGTVGKIGLDKIRGSGPASHKHGSAHGVGHGIKHGHPHGQKSSADEIAFEGDFADGLDFGTNFAGIAKELDAINGGGGGGRGGTGSGEDVGVGSSGINIHYNQHPSQPNTVIRLEDVIDDVAPYSSSATFNDFYDQDPYNLEMNYFTGIDSEGYGGHGHHGHGHHGHSHGKYDDGSWYTNKHVYGSDVFIVIRNFPLILNHHDGEIVGSVDIGTLTEENIQEIICHGSKPFNKICSCVVHQKSFLRYIVNTQRVLFSCFFGRYIARPDLWGWHRC